MERPAPRRSGVLRMRVSASVLACAGVTCPLRRCSAGTGGLSQSCSGPGMERTGPKIAPPRFEGPLNHGRFVHNSAPPYHNLFRPLRYHPGAARSALKPVGTASGC